MTALVDAAAAYYYLRYATYIHTYIPNRLVYLGLLSKVQFLPWFAIQDTVPTLPYSRTTTVDLSYSMGGV